MIYRVATVPASALPVETSSILPGLGEALKNIATDQGLLGSVLVITLAAVVILWRERSKRDADYSAEIEACHKAHAEDRDEWQREREALQERRFAEIRETLTALNNNTGALTVISQSLADRSASSQEIARALHELSVKMGEVLSGSVGHTKSIDRNLEVISQILRAVDRLVERRASGGGGS